MTNQLKQQWQGTDDESRIETYGGGSSYWLATPFPKTEMVFAVVIGLASVISVPLLWSNNAGAALGLGALGLVFAAYAAAGSLWTTRHPEQAGHHLAAASHYNNVKWRKHPLSVAGGIIVFGFVDGFVRFNDGGMGERLIAGVSLAGLAALVSGLAIWHARRKAPSQNG